MLNKCIQALGIYHENRILGRERFWPRREESGGFWVGSEEGGFGKRTRFGFRVQAKRRRFETNTILTRKAKAATTKRRRFGFDEDENNENDKKNEKHENWRVPGSGRNSGGALRGEEKRLNKGESQRPGAHRPIGRAAGKTKKTTKMKPRERGDHTRRADLQTCSIKKKTKRSGPMRRAALKEGPSDGQD